MNKRAQEAIYSSQLLSAIACCISRLRNPSFPSDVERRKDLSLFNYKELCKPLPKYYEELCTDNNCFGIGKSLRRYSGFNKHYIRGWIEHGYFYADTISELSELSFSKSIITFGDHRESIINRLLPQKKCYKIGPYIHYADDYINEEAYAKIKESLGRVLLVFPAHSGTGAKVHYETDYLFKLVDTVKKGFDTVLFSLFWSDIDDNYVGEIERRGYKIVCSGHRYDPYFLSRQKTIIKLSDVTMSNGLGTNLVYCTYYKKPHWLIKQERQFLGINTDGKKHLEYIKKNKNNSSVAPLLYEAFGHFSDVLTNEQYMLCSDLFGFDDIKKPEEMLALLESLK